MTAGSLPVEERTLLAAAAESIATALSVSATPCVTCSFQAEDMVVLDLVRRERPDIPVLFLETGYHFAEVYAYRDAMTARYGLNLINLAAVQSVTEQESQFGLLYQTAPDQCCKRRKVEPLFRALADYDAWFTGLRRVQSPTRANLEIVDSFQLPCGRRIAKISPLAHWTDRDVWQFAAAHAIPLLTLYDQGYTSIGCEPCTRKPDDALHPRSGRWAGRKLECGIHIEPPAGTK
jgi:phosphoadenosine phosphosulfate reductase